MGIQQIGGQAVIEGVMIRSPHFVVTSVRKGKKIISKKERFVPISERIMPLSWPFLRGLATFFEMLYLGIRTLNYSAEQSAPDGTGKGSSQKITKTELAVSFAIAIVAAALLFVALPYSLTNLLGLYEENHPVLFNLADGAIKLTIFILYIVLISRMKEIKRIFQYHGAEHKAVHCYEAGKKLSVTNAKKFSPVHMRCGTSFIIAAVIVSILLFSLIPAIVKMVAPGIFGMFWLWKRLLLLLLRFAAMLPIVAVSYEFLRMSAKFGNSQIVRIIAYPGMLIQKLTTNEPDRRQLETALTSVRLALELEKNFAKKHTRKAKARL
jgi:uncharacterized protein YqhQ